MPCVYYIILVGFIGFAFGFGMSCLLSIHRYTRLEDKLTEIRRKGYDNYMAEWGERFYKGGIKQ